MTDSHNPNDGGHQNVFDISDASFQKDVLEAKELTLVDFWAEWCGPCRMLAPTIKTIADALKGKLKVCKVNVDENKQYASQYHVRGIPTLILFKGGEPVDQLVGNQPKEAILETINKHLD